jgi:hypothetical protein
MSEKIESWEGIDDRIRVKGGRGKYRLIETFDYVSCFSMASYFRPCTIRSALPPNARQGDDSIFSLISLVCICSLL